MDSIIDNEKVVRKKIAKKSSIRPSIIDAVKKDLLVGDPKFKREVSIDEDLEDSPIRSLSIKKRQSTKGFARKSTIKSSSSPVSKFNR